MIDDLSKALSNNQLEKFLESNENYIRVLDFFTLCNHKELDDSREKVEELVLEYWFPNKNQISIENSKVLVLITTLLETTERLALSAAFQYLLEFFKLNNLNIPERIKYVYLYLSNITRVEHYGQRLDDFLNGMQKAYEAEESIKGITATTLHYYAQVVQNLQATNQPYIEKFKASLLAKSLDIYTFLDQDIFNDVFAIDTTLEDCYSQIQSLIDSYLARTGLPEHFFIGNLLEYGTEYAELIAAVNPSFFNFRNVAVSLNNRATIDYYHQLQQGVAVLETTEQLCAYMNSYGPMHFAKLKAAIDTLNNEYFPTDIEVIDWGAGQGFGSVVLMEERSNLQYSNVTLIEPSKVALERAALHVNMLNDKVEINTVHKDLDNLNQADISSDDSKTKVHVFSNILDMDSFNQSKLLNLIKNKFTGLNYFVCVSPSINTVRTAGLDSFIDSFKHLDEYKVLGTLSKSKHSWKKTWSIEMRVFKAVL